MDWQEAAKKYGIQEIGLPGWGVDDTFLCKVRRPTLYNMAASGLIPNPLLSVVQDMFTVNSKKLDKIPLDKQGQALIQIARYAMVEPTYEEIVEAGLNLTDVQLLVLYTYAMGGVAALEPFRKDVRGTTDEHGGDVSGAAK